MNREFWKERWDTGQIGFHQSVPTPALVRHIGRLAPGPSRVLVPLCGKALDLSWLHARGHHVIGVELVLPALEAFKEEHPIGFHRTEDARKTVFSAERMSLICADFFDLTQGDVGDVDAVFDRAALVALPSDLRPRYAAHVLDLLRPGGRMLLVSFEYDASKMSGPPFSVDEAEIQGLYTGAGTLEQLERRDILEEEPRFRERGLTRLFESVWLLERGG